MGTGKELLLEPGNECLLLIRAVASMLRRVGQEIVTSFLNLTSSENCQSPWFSSALFACSLCPSWQAVARVDSCGVGFTMGWMEVGW